MLSKIAKTICKESNTTKPENMKKKKCILDITDPQIILLSLYIQLNLSQSYSNLQGVSINIHWVLFCAGMTKNYLCAQKKFRVKKVCQNYSIADAISRNLSLNFFCAKLQTLRAKKNSHKKDRAKKGPGVYYLLL